MRRALALVAALGLAHPAAAEDADWAYGDAGESPLPPPPPPPGEPAVDVDVGMPAPGASPSLEMFRGSLAPYGEWVFTGAYGQVWRPTGVPAGWRPYYYGRWEWTSEGWLWVSDEAFGWATYHYGRWAYHPTFGWVWVPGTQWAPAWVTWRYSPDYVGWAPLAPGYSVYVSAFPVVYSWWTFVPCGYFVGLPVHRYAYGPTSVPRIWGITRPAPPRATAFGHAAPAWGGPARGFLEGRIGQPILPVRVQPVSSPAAVRSAGRAGVVPVFRPEARPSARAAWPSPYAPQRALPAAAAGAAVQGARGQGGQGQPAPGHGKR